ncbi:hypothetical protein WP50_08635 [Lactiplantibacillus plantarum]|nr:hypothetical protein WP50_08635 [Lactiplantibacillus plantarum]
MGLIEREEKAKAGGKIGTTNKGIGPAYMDKAERIGIRVADLLDKDTFAALLKRNLAEKNQIITKLYDLEPRNLEESPSQCDHYG